MCQMVVTSEKFPYGYDIEVHIEKALAILKARYPWAERSQFCKYYRYAIEAENGEYHFVRYVIFSEQDIKRELWDVNPPSPYQVVKNADDFIKTIVSDNDYKVLHSNEEVERYPIAFEQGRQAGCWYLEKYYFKRMETGDFFVFVQAGDCRTGGSRDFFLPRDFFQGSFQDFLVKYETLIPGDSFGLYREDLEKDIGLKKFLGFEA